MKGAASRDGAAPVATRAAAARSAQLSPHRRQRPPRLRLPPPPPPPPPPPDHLCRPLEPAPLASPRRAPSDRFPGAPQSAFTGGRSLETDAELSCKKILCGKESSQKHLSYISNTPNHKPHH
ncbi:sulfated surface glycoprotein 185-like isoform X2 [Pipra filicauda]|uniref:Sulfated surface glycoprotein 185-like isoform X2 n=1 Tax=Pipra filicauda TaxID=649802 RepID=A0A7R5K3E1_9PASS|nr:sulfated surface glycoprotein 185-like isoform X2 [Pipra filicauda]